jgi:hypothetical protein
MCTVIGLFRVGRENKIVFRAGEQSRGGKKTHGFNPE